MYVDQQSSKFNLSFFFSSGFVELTDYLFFQMLLVKYYYYSKILCDY